MLSSPLTLTVGSTDHTLARVNQDNFGSTFFKKGENLEVTLKVRNSYEGKVGPGQFERHNVDVVYTTYDANGVPSTIQAYFVLRMKRGGSSALPADVGEGLAALVTSNLAAIADWAS